MAYKYTRRSPRRVGRRVSRKKGRTVSGRKRTRRTRRVPRRTSNRRILNVSSVKKARQLPRKRSHSHTLIYYGVGGVALPPMNLTYTTFMWSPTYRFLAGSETASYTRRTATRIFYRGFRENIEMVLRDSAPVQWRRMVVGSNLNVVNTASYDSASTNTYGRTQVPNQTSYTAFLESHFPRNQRVDWNNPMTAKVDTKRVTVYHDRLMTIQPDTQSGALRKYKMWHPINKNFAYDDEENGAVIQSSPYMANEPPNHNIYVVDIFTQVNGAQGLGPLFSTQATSYWHER
ncbi:capsid protein [Plant associated genomovirus 24]|uniref:Capsid protein n=1 Tax=Plant associated genomovirus 24 TaxID=2584396 RepID=A0A4Y5QCP4_9VIRU|nr:capsid protein [Plant associated genomovirus 24]QCX29506.1 capsid protein [Plant associated genomovirus 24]QCX29508.1 capsid protein [Plant associated genomovirus 24]